MREISRHGMTIVTKSPPLNGPEEGRLTILSTKNVFPCDAPNGRVSHPPQLIWFKHIRRTRVRDSHLDFFWAVVFFFHEKEVSPSGFEPGSKHLSNRRPNH